MKIINLKHTSGCMWKDFCRHPVVSLRLNNEICWIMTKPAQNSMEYNHLSFTPHRNILPVYKAFSTQIGSSAHSFLSHVLPYLNPPYRIVGRIFFLITADLCINYQSKVWNNYVLFFKSN